MFITVFVKGEKLKYAIKKIKPQKGKVEKTKSKINEG